MAAWANAAPARISAATQMTSMSSSGVATLSGRDLGMTLDAIGILRDMGNCNGDQLLGRQGARCECRLADGSEDIVDAGPGWREETAACRLAPGYSYCRPSEAHGGEAFDPHQAKPPRTS